jgi:hypothetical protein
LQIKIKTKKDDDLKEKGEKVDNQELAGQRRNDIKPQLFMMENPNDNTDDDNKNKENKENIDDNAKHFKYPGLEHLNTNFEDIYKGKFETISISKCRLFFFVCFGGIFRKQDINSFYYYLGRDFLSHDLGVVTVLKKLIEYESLKKILLKENQILLLKKHQSRPITMKDGDKSLEEIKSLTHIETNK